ncbi:MAG TPA: hypothetical protein VN680_12180 [Burkholderiaceae bacterium]|jgi:hypothetical protein|nr:hypothetical protein [Burkholderiaceae bacterium]
MKAWEHFWESVAKSGMPHQGPHPQRPPGAPLPWLNGPWTPQALAESQLQMWHHGMEAMRSWWSYMFISWPHLRELPPAGVLEPPEPSSPAAAAQAEELEEEEPPEPATPPRARSRPARRGRG